MYVLECLIYTGVKCQRPALPPKPCTTKSKANQTCGIDIPKPKEIGNYIPSTQIKVNIRLFSLSQSVFKHRNRYYARQLCTHDIVTYFDIPN